MNYTLISGEVLCHLLQSANSTYVLSPLSISLVVDSKVTLILCLHSFLFYDSILSVCMMLAIHPKRLFILKRLTQTCLALKLPSVLLFLL